MELNLTVQERDFRDSVRKWLSEVELPEGLRDYGATPTFDDIAAAREWQRLLFDSGYAGLSWPQEHGGAGSTVIERGIWAEETARASVPQQLNLVGPELAGPMIMEFGTEAQKAEHLPSILSGGRVWCQLFSEPEAGSDLAGIVTRAKATNEGWRVSGQKIWSSGAHYSDYGLLLARTASGDRPHQGLSVFLVPMNRSGIDVRPMKQMDGQVKFNEVFLDDVVVLEDELLGQVDQGWSVALATLGRERIMIGASAIRFIKSLHDLWREMDRRDIANDALLRDEWAKLWSRTQLLRLYWYRLLSTMESAQDSRTSLLKVYGTELDRDLTIFASHVLGEDAVAGSEYREWRLRWLAAPAQTIAGGTSEIQRNIIARRVLGLPRD